MDRIAFFPSINTVLKGWCSMNLRRELRAYSRACEHLLSLGHTLTDEERSFLEYYANELSRVLLSDKPTVLLGYRGTVAAER
jgi:hypothetical protein